MFTQRHSSSFDNLLAQTKPFEECTRRQLRRVAELVTFVDVAPGRVLTRQGDPGDECFVVLHGQLRVERYGASIATIDDGEIAGELALLDHAPRTGTVTATDQTSLFVMSRREFSTLCHLAFPSAQRYLEGVAAGRRRALRQVADATPLAEVRIA
jgi:CRP-like cAMP-binding protein